MRRLVYQYSATLSLPCTSPCIALIIFLVSPAEHHNRPKHGLTNLSFVNRILYSNGRWEKSPLAYNAELFICARCSFNHGIAIFKRRSEWFFHQHMRASFHRLNGTCPVIGMGRANNHYLDFFATNHL